MARDSSGTYTRISNSFTQPVTATSISSAHADAFFDELETEMTDSLSRSGKGGMSADLDMNNNDINEVKTVVFQGSSSGTTTVQSSAAASGTLTLPAATDTLVGRATTDTLTNKTLSSPTITVSDDVLTIRDNSDNTKQLQFQLSGITTGNTRTLTIPDASTTIVGTDTTQTLSNKTLSAPTITGHPVIEGVTPTGATGTGNMVFSASPTFTGTITAAAANFSGTITFGTGTITGLTADGSPDAANDYLLSYDASAGALKKVLIGTVVGSVGTVTSWNGMVGAVVSSTPSAITNLGIAASVAGSALTIAIKDASGSDPSAGSPVVISFRNVTASTGTPSTVSITGAASLTVSSGSTLGTANSTPFHLLVVGFNDGGTFRLGVINTSASGEIYPVASIGIASSTAEGGAGAADSAGVFYTGTAVTSKAYVVLARLSYNATPPATAGAWANGPDRIELVHSDFKYPGDVVQVRRASSTANTTSSTTIPIDDTVPQDTEGGSSGMSVSITPTSQANWLRIQTLHYVGTASAAHAITSLFQNVNPSAIAASLGFNSTASTVTPQMIDVTILANSVTSNAFTTRFGANSGNAGLNGNAATRYLGGVMTSWISVAEIQG